MTYGTQTCVNCIGYGIELRPTEIARIKKEIIAGTKPGSVLRPYDDIIIRCPICGGLGWVFVANYPHIILPTQTLKRW